MLISRWVLFEFILDGVFSDLVEFKLQYLNRGVLNYLNFWFFLLLSFCLFFFLVSEVFIIPLMKTKMVIYEVLRYSCQIFVWSGVICKKCMIRKKWNGDVAYRCYAWGLRWIGGKYVVFSTLRMSCTQGQPIWRKCCKRMTEGYFITYCNWLLNKEPNVSSSITTGDH